MGESATWLYTWLGAGLAGGSVAVVAWALWPRRFIAETADLRDEAKGPADAARRVLLDRMAPFSTPLLSEKREGLLKRKIMMMGAPDLRPVDIITMQVLSKYVIEKMRESGEIAGEEEVDQEEMPIDNVSWIKKKMAEDGSGGVMEDTREQRLRLSRKRWVAVLKMERRLSEIKKTWWKQKVGRTWIECCLTPFYEGWRERLRQQNDDFVREATVRFRRREEAKNKFKPRDPERISAMLAIVAKK